VSAPTLSGADAIRAALADAARAIGGPEDLEPILERPRDPAFGEWTTNLAMTLARSLRRKPREIADALVERLDLAAAGVRSAEVAGAGFINFRLDPAHVARGLAPIVEQGDAYGRDAAWAGERVVVEFVSANPTGPLHVGHGRQAALGDAISTLLAWQGWEVSREFYYNDAGAQIENLAKSVWARLAQRSGVDAALPEGGYHGDYIAEIADDFVRARDVAGEPAVDADVLRAGAAAMAAGGRPPDAELFDAVRAHAVAALRAEQDLDLRAFGVAFDTYYLESSLYTDGRVARTVDALVDAGATYEQDGALFLRTTPYGDDKDRVMRRSAARAASTRTSSRTSPTTSRSGSAATGARSTCRGATTTAPRRACARAAGARLGIPEGYPEYVLHQMVTVVRGGEEVKISKRAGSYVTGARPHRLGRGATRCGTST
jgi:arginyl-tRNA synthetase